MNFQLTNISSRLIGLESEEETTVTTEESQTESSTEPCVGLCQLEKTNQIEKDPGLSIIQAREGKRCVGLCYLLRSTAYHWSELTRFSQEERTEGGSTTGKITKK